MKSDHILDAKEGPVWESNPDYVQTPETEYVVKKSKNLWSDRGIEPRTSCTQSRNHASRPIGLL